MKSHIEQRAVTIAKYILEKQSTVRQTAKVFGVSKSTVHKDVTERLEEIQPTLASEVKQILEKNKSERNWNTSNKKRCRITYIFFLTKVRFLPIL